MRAIEERLNGPGPLSAGIVLPDNTSQKCITFKPKPSKEEVRDLIAADPRRHFVNLAKNFGAAFSEPPRIAPEVLDDPWKADRKMSPQRAYSRTQIKYRSHGELFPEVKDSHAAKFEKVMARRKPKELTPSLAAIKSLGLVGAASPPSASSGPAPPPTRDQLKQLTRMVMAQPHIDMPRMSPKVRGKLTRARSAVQFWQSMGYQGDPDDDSAGNAPALDAPADAYTPPQLSGPVKHLRAFAGPDRSHGRSTLREITPWRSQDEDRRLRTLEKDLRERRQLEHVASVRALGLGDTLKLG